MTTRELRVADDAMNMQALHTSSMGLFGMIGLVALFFSGCSNIEHKPRGFNETTPTAEVRKIAIFFDGTANDEGSDTNIKRLHSLITLQDRKNIASLYLLGVGTNSDEVGAITGSGINARVKIAYEFILNHYDPRRQELGYPADEIYIFGFSRGAFAARILTTMLYFAGFVEEVSTDKGEFRQYTSTQISGLVHEATFPGFGRGAADDSPLRRETLASALRTFHLQAVQDKDQKPFPVPVKVLGLWDTVEALGLPGPAEHLKLAFRSTPPSVNVDEPNKRYGERLCNVERAYHALSIDDNRATIFTPLLLSRAHLFAGCPRLGAGEDPLKEGGPMLDSAGSIRLGRLQEVWFSGAHADVGGGYLISTLNGVSLNWMLDQLKGDGLLPQRVGKEEKNARFVREDILGSSHDPTAGWWAIPYPRVSRDLVAYARDENALKEFKGAICVHESVFKRRRLISNEPHEYSQLVLTQPERVQLVMGPYGKGRNWQWLQQGQVRNGPSGPMIEVQQYPNCSFMPVPKDGS